MGYDIPSYKDLVLAMLPWAQNCMCPKPKIQIGQLQSNFDHYCLSWGKPKSVDGAKKLYRYLSPNSLCTYCTGWGKKFKNSNKGELWVAKIEKKGSHRSCYIPTPFFIIKSGNKIQTTDRSCNQQLFWKLL